MPVNSNLGPFYRPFRVRHLFIVNYSDVFRAADIYVVIDFGNQSVLGHYNTGYKVDQSLLLFRGKARQIEHYCPSFLDLIG